MNSRICSNIFDNLWRIWFHRSIIFIEKRRSQRKTLPRISNFQDQVSTKLLDTIRIPSGKQFVLRGLASEGKTTEIRRLAYSIQQQLDSATRNFEQSIGAFAVHAELFRNRSEHLHCG